MTARGSPDTDELLNRAARGDRGAQSRLLDRHRDQLRRMIAVRLDRRLLPRLDPSDVVQETLAEAAQKLSDYLRVRPVPFYPWLRRLAWEHLVRLHERHVTARRRSIAREAFSLRGLPDESAIQLAEQLASFEMAPDQRLVQAEMKSRALRALAQLAERDRELLVLRYLEQMPNSEIARLWSCSEGAVRTRHTRALARLVTIMSRDPDASG